MNGTAREKISYLVINLIDENATLIMHEVSWEAGDPVELISYVICKAHPNALITGDDRTGQLQQHLNTPGAKQNGCHSALYDIYS